VAASAAVEPDVLDFALEGRPMGLALPRNSRAAKTAA